MYESEKNFASTTVDDRYRIFNNGWNAKANTGPFRQKVFVKESNGKPIFGWAWKWWGGGTDVASYPEIQVGHSPWAGEVAPNSGFPFRVGSKKLVVDYDVSMRASGSYDLAFEFWAVSSPPVTKSGITHEVMIWLDENRLGPAGSLVATATIAWQSIPHLLCQQPRRCLGRQFQHLDDHFPASRQTHLARPSRHRRDHRLPGACPSAG